MTTPDESALHPATLVFVIHGLNGNSARVADLVTVAQGSYPEAQVVAPTFSYAHQFSRRRGPSIVRDIIQQIDAIHAAHPFERLILIDHSMGAVLGRRVLIEASGLAEHWDDAGNLSPTSLRIEPELQGISKHVWADKVDMLVMMASFSRGWSLEHAQSGVQGLLWRIGAIVGHLMPRGAKPTLFDFCKGSPFIVQTRLRWLQYCQAMGDARPALFQFLGTVDEIAPPNDTIDFATDGGGTKFAQIEIPYSGHASLVDLFPKTQTPQGLRDIMKQRRALFQAVLTGDRERYLPHQIKRAHVLDELPPALDPTVKNLVFVVHGIRDKGYWTKKIAARIKETAEQNGTTFVSRTPSYGYFPIIRFLLPWYRRQKTEWLMDQYVEALATYQSADVHYMGHSNGTYLCARALADYPMARFKHIMFAGSVVHPSFAWKPLVDAGRVSKILNLVATADIVVAVFPNGLRHLKWFFDLGGVGHLGFEEKGLPDHLYQMDHGSDLGTLARAYVQGGHTAPRAEGLWDEIAQFIVSGTPPPAEKPHPLFHHKQKWFIQKLGRLSPLIVTAIATLVIYIGAGLVYNFASATGFLGGPLDEISSHPWQSAVYLVLYLVVLRFMALRF